MAYQSYRISPVVVGNLVHVRIFSKRENIDPDFIESGTVVLNHDEVVPFIQIFIDAREKGERLRGQSFSERAEIVIDKLTIAETP